MRYAYGGGLTARARAARERVRLQAAEMFEQRLPTGEIAARLRVSAKSVCEWRRAWLAGGLAGPASLSGARTRPWHLTSGFRRGLVLVDQAAEDRRVGFQKSA